MEQGKEVRRFSAGTRFLPHCPSPGQARLVWLPTTVSWSPLAPTQSVFLMPAQARRCTRSEVTTPPWFSSTFPRTAKRIISAGDATVRIWDARTGQEIQRLRGHEHPILVGIAGCRPQFLGHQRL